jgi:DNA-binding XRE family transcriptional regulator
MTQKQLAEHVGVSRQTMNAIENARIAPTIDIAIRVADVLGVSVDELFDLDYEGRPARPVRRAAVAARPPPAGLRRLTGIERDPAPAAKEPDKEVTFADLRKVIGPDAP